MGNCVGSKGAKKDPKILTEEEINRLLANTSLTRREIVTLHQNFLKECPTGKLTKKDFVKLFKEVHPSENKNEKADKFCEYVFKVIDKDNLGYISFEEFVICFSLTSHGSFEKKCEFAFKLYDLDRDGKISKKEMTQVLTALYDLSGITDRKGANAPAKKVDEIVRKINLKNMTPEEQAAAAAAAASAKPAKVKKEKPVKDKSAPKKTKEEIKAEKDRQKAEKEAEKKEKAEKARIAKEQKAKEAKEKKEKAAENKAKGIKEPKPEKKPKEPKPAKAGKAPKAAQFITREQFIDACNTDDTLKKLFVDSIFSQQADQSMLESKIDDIAAKLNVELPSASLTGPSISSSSSSPNTRKIHVNAPKVHLANNGPVSNDDTKFISTTTTKVTSAKNNEQPVTVTTTTKLNPDGTITTTEQKVDPNSDSDQTQYSEHVEYVTSNNNNNNTNNNNNLNNQQSNEITKNILLDVSLDGLKVTESDKQQPERSYQY